MSVRAMHVFVCEATRAAHIEVKIGSAAARSSEKVSGIFVYEGKDLNRRARRARCTLGSAGRKKR
jgi:hypothetical protein